eukprot:3187934-Prymnesium_polylepis.1
MRARGGGGAPRAAPVARRELPSSTRVACSPAWTGQSQTAADARNAKVTQACAGAAAVRRGGGTNESRR